MPRVMCCRRQYEATGHPRGLGLIYAASAGNSKGRGAGLGPGLGQLATACRVTRRCRCCRCSVEQSLLGT